MREGGRERGNGRLCMKERGPGRSGSGREVTGEWAGGRWDVVME